MNLRRFLLFLLSVNLAHAGGPQQMFFGLELDPGTRGETFNSRIVNFNDLDGVDADGVGLQLQFNLELDEQLRFTDTGSDGFDIVMELVYSGPSGPLGSIPDCTVAMNPIFEASAVPPGSSVVVNGNTVTYTAHFEDEEGVLFNRLTFLQIDSSAPLGPGSYIFEQIAFTSSAGPQVLSIDPDSTGPVPGATGMNYTVLFSEPVTGFNNVFDITTVTTNVSGATPPFPIETTDNRSYTFTLRPRIIDGQPNGTLVVSMDPTGGIIDAGGNGLVGPNPASELVTFSATAYQQWAIDEGLTPGLNFGYSQDPDQDDRINGAEFVRNTSALNADDPQREFFHITEIDGVTYGTFTVASRISRSYFEIEDGWLQSDFSGGPDGFVVDVADNIRATDDLSFDRFTSPATVLDPTIVNPPGLPALDAGWSWYHFRFEDETDTLEKGFMRTEIEDLD